MRGDLRHRHEQTGSAPRARRGYGHRLDAPPHPLAQTGSTPGGSSPYDRVSHVEDHCLRPIQFAALALVFLTSAPVFADQAALISPLATARPAIARHGMIVSQEAAASRVGLDILKRGGNAVDAAVAVGFALAVTLPRAGNLGGGGFMLIHRADLNQTIAIDYRATAPAATTK